MRSRTARATQRLIRGNSAQRSGWVRQKEMKLRREVEGGERERKASFGKRHQAQTKALEQLSLDSVARMSRTASER